MRMNSGPPGAEPAYGVSKNRGCVVGFLPREKNRPGRWAGPEIAGAPPGGAVAARSPWSWQDGTPLEVG